MELFLLAAIILLVQLSCTKTLWPQMMTEKEHKCDRENVKQEMGAGYIVCHTVAADRSPNGTTDYVFVCVCVCGEDSSFWSSECNGKKAGGGPAEEKKRKKNPKAKSDEMEEEDG